MRKQEETYSINDKLIDQEFEIPVKTNKIKYTIAIITCVVMAATIAFLLIGHFQFNLFRSETYKIKADIYRSNFQTHYFFEQKDIEIVASFSNGQKEEKKFS